MINYIKQTIKIVLLLPIYPGLIAYTALNRMAKNAPLFEKRANIEKIAAYVLLLLMSLGFWLLLSLLPVISE